jgi:GNAT superfamily N-acetyltransferase
MKVNLLLNVRKAILADAGFIVQSQLAMAHETEEMQLDPPTVQKGVAAVFADPAKGEYFIAEIQDPLRGAFSVGCLLTIPEWSDWRNGAVLWIHSVYVLPEHRINKVFKAMYGHLRAMVENNDGMRGLRLYVDKRNTRAKAVYEKLGMTADHYELYEWMK